MGSPRSVVDSADTESGVPEAPIPPVARLSHYPIAAVNQKAGVNRRHHIRSTAADNQRLGYGALSHWPGYLANG